MRLMGSFQTMTSQGRSGSVTSSPTGRSTSTGAVMVAPSLMAPFSQSRRQDSAAARAPPGAGRFQAVVTRARIEEDLGDRGNHVGELLSKRGGELLDLVGVHPVLQVDPRRH